MTKMSGLRIGWSADPRLGHIIIAIAHAAWRRHVQGRQARVVAWYSEMAWRIMLHPTPAPAGDKRPHYIF